MNHEMPPRIPQFWETLILSPSTKITIVTQLIVLIGLPGSGKSSLVARFLAKCPRIPVISTDVIRAQLFGSEAVQGSWLLVWHQVQQQMQQAVEQSVDAIYDATNAVRSHRVEAIASARTTGFTHITGIWLDTPVQLCLERNQRRDRIVPEEVIWQMHSSLRDAPPSLQDGLDRLIRYTYTEFSTSPSSHVTTSVS